MGILGSIGSLVGGLFGGGDADQKRMRDLYQEGLTGMQNVNAEQGASAVRDIAINPQTKTAQMRALGALQGEAAQGGLTAQDRAAQQQSMDATAQQERGQREAIQQQAAARGAAGGGSALASQMAAQQGAAQRNSMVGTQQVADARSRALAAMAGAGKLGGDIQGQEFQQGMGISQAKDAIDRFNAGQRLAKQQAVLGAQKSTADMYGSEAARKKAEAAAMGGAIGDIGGGVLSMFTGGIG